MATGNEINPLRPSAPRNRKLNVGRIYPKASGVVTEQPEDEPEAPAEVVGPVPEPEPTGWWAKYKGTVQTVGLLLLAPIIALFVSNFVMQSYQVSGPSMNNTLQNNDRLIVDKWPRTVARLTGHQYVPRRGDIIIADAPDYPGIMPGEQIVKRVIGLPGEHIVVNGNSVTVYNKQDPSGFMPDKNAKYKVRDITEPIKVDVTLAVDQIFVCGDNRGNSTDSRYFGPLKVSSVVGKVSFRVMPFNKINRL